MDKEKKRAGRMSKKTVEKSAKETGVNKNPVEERIEALADEIIARAKSPEESLAAPPKETPSPVPETPSVLSSEVVTKTIDTTITQTQITPPPEVPEKPQEKKPETAIPPQFMSDLVQEENSPLIKSYKIFIISITALITAILVLIIFYFSKNEVKLPSATISPTPVPEVEASPTPEFDKSQFTLEILNGSGVSGAAKKYATKLSELGYRIVKTGNADKSSYKSPELLVNKNFEDKAKYFIQDVQSEIKITSISGELKNSTAAARLIIGKE